MPVLLAILNLVFAHIAIAFENYYLSAILLTISFALMISQAFCRKAACKYCICSAILLSMIALLMVLDSKWMTYFPPLMIHLFLFLFFFAPFVTAKTPVITRIALAIKGRLSAKEQHYTAQASTAWAIFMLALLLEAIVIAILQPIETWSLFVNFINYIFVAIMFAGEFMVRRLILKNEVEHSFFKFLMQLKNIDLGSMVQKVD